MLATETPQPLERKHSIFRRISRRHKASDRFSHVDPHSDAGYPRRMGLNQPRSSEEAASGLPTPPASPERHIVVKNGLPGKPHMSTPIQDTRNLPRHQIHHDHRKHNSSYNTPLRVVPTAFPTRSFAGTPTVRSWNVFLLPLQIFSLYLGFLPRCVTDEWFIYSEGPDRNGKLKIHFHQSWTGMKLAELFVVMDVKGEGAGKLLGIKWSNSYETNYMDEEEVKYMIGACCRRNLGVELEVEK